MASNVYPAAAASSSSNLAQSFTATSANTLYAATGTFSAGIYTVTCVNSTVAKIDFWNGSTYIGTATTVSGSVSYNLASAATKLEYFIDTGSNVTINLALTGTNLTGAPSGTLDTLTTSQTYNQTGAMYVVVVGGGGGGAGSNSSGSGGGGGSGGVTGGILTIASPVSVTVGAAGNSGGTGSGGSGGASIFSNLTANGGGGGTGTGSVTHGAAGAGGTPGGGGGGTGGGANGNAGTASSASPYPFAVTGTTGGGGNQYGAGAGSGIGTGGAGGNGSGSPAASGTGYGSGGGGASYSGAGGAGRPGVIYVVRGI